jgi:hypothetical protein
MLTDDGSSPFQANPWYDAAPNAPRKQNKAIAKIHFLLKSDPPFGLRTI